MPTSDPVVLVVGSLHHDIMIHADHLPQPDETAVGSHWYPKFGGKGGNQAVAAAQAGIATRMFGAVGDDDFGRFLLAGLDRAGVDRQFVPAIKGIGSGMSVATVAPNGDYAATIVSGANLQMQSKDLLNPALWQNVRVLVLQNEAPDAINLTAATEAQRQNVIVLLNAAPARQLPSALEALVGVLIVNSVEAEMMGAPSVTDLASASQAAEKLSKNFAAVIVTAGAAGLAVAGPDGRFAIPARKVTVISSHGAGDCFVGTLAAELARGAPLRAGCTTASHAAANHVAGKHSDC